MQQRAGGESSEKNNIIGLAELVSQAGLAALPEVDAPQAVPADYVDVPVYGDDYATGLVQPLYQLMREKTVLKAKLDEATLPNRLMSCSLSKWPHPALCAGALGDILALLRRYVAAERGLRRHTDRLFVRKEVERLSPEGRAVVKAFYGEERDSDTSVFEDIAAALSPRYGAGADARRLQKEIRGEKEHLTREHRAIRDMVLNWAR